MLDEGLRNFALVCKACLGRDVSCLQGAGAAGGAGAGLNAVLGAELIPGIDLFLNVAGFETALQDCDLVITGEGKMDDQTLMGKAPMGVLRAAAARAVPVIAIVGTAVISETLLSSGFAGIFPVTGRHSDIAEAMKPEAAKRKLKKTAARIAERLKDIQDAELSDALGMLACDYQF